MTGGVFTLGESRLGGPDGLGSERFIKVEQALAEWSPSRGTPPDGRDWLHLHTRHIRGRDRFLTWDEPMLELGRLLEPHLALGVTRPDDYLAERGEQPPSAVGR